MTDDADLSLEQAVAQVVERMVKLTHDLARTKVHDDHDWFREMLVGILISAYQNYQALKAGVPLTPTLACWGARNLLELRMIATYVLQSEDNAVDFIDDLAADTREFWESIGKVGRFSHNELVTEMRAAATGEEEPWKSIMLRKADELEQAGPDLRGTESELAKAEKMMAASGVPINRKPKQGSVIAKKINENERYSSRYKVLSKIVHPTSLSIAAQTSVGSLDELVPMVDSQGATDMLAIFYMIEEHIAAYGIGWQI